MRVALVHDWLNGMRGGEKCLEAIAELFPESPIFTLFYERGKVAGEITRHKICVSPLDKFPRVHKRYRNYLPVFPAMIESFDFDGYDLVISTSHCVAKGAKKKKSALHVCYCFTPMRYAWGFFEEYFGKRNPLSRAVIGVLIACLRTWDLYANVRVDHFVAISHHVRKRIEKHYGRQARVIYPPCDTAFYSPDASVGREDFYLAVSALVPYKKIELAIEAFGGSSRKLVVIGDGPERKNLEKAASDNIQFLGWQPDELLRDYYRRAKALIFPGEEDFGIVPLEAQACGCPVIAYGVGGALETVIRGRTGVFFDQSTAGSLNQALDQFENMSLEPGHMRDNALGFSRERFKDEIKKMIESIRTI